MKWFVFSSQINRLEPTEAILQPDAGVVMGGDDRRDKSLNWMRDDNR